METFELELTEYELAKLVEGDIPRFLDEGELALIHHAGKLNQAKRDWKDMPNLESPEAMRVRATGDAFCKEYESYCRRRAKKVAH